MKSRLKFIKFKDESFGGIVKRAKHEQEAKTFHPENYYFDSFDWDGTIAHLNNKDLS